MVFAAILVSLIEGNTELLITSPVALFLFGCMLGVMGKRTLVVGLLVSNMNLLLFFEDLYALEKGRVSFYS